MSDPHDMDDFLDDSEDDELAEHEAAESDFWESWRWDEDFGREPAIAKETSECKVFLAPDGTWGYEALWLHAEGFTSAEAALWDALRNTAAILAAKLAATAKDQESN